MRNHKFSLALSFIYCGLGQVYKGQVLKGMDFMIIYTFLITSFVFANSPALLRLLNLLVIMLMWFMGMLDAYMNDEGPVEREGGLTWMKLTNALSAVVICAAIFTLFVLQDQIFAALNGNSTPDSYEISSSLEESYVSLEDNAEVSLSEADDVMTAPEPAIAELGDTLPETEDPSGPHIPGDAEFFSIQVAAFKDPKNAEKLNSELLSKGYPTRIERPASTEGEFYHVLIGRFDDHEETEPLAKELLKREGLSCMIVRRNGTERMQ